jgi:HSP20 family molecular chaperone IbpA
MSLISYGFSDPFSPISLYRPRRQFAVNPFREIERLDRAMNSLMGQLQQIPDQELGAQLQYNDNGDFSVRCQTAGFKPEELNVDLEGERLFITGKHMEERDGESIERNFSRVIRLPKELDAQKIKCELADNGELCVQVPRLVPVEAPKQKVPIEMKKPEEKSE